MDLVFSKVAGQDSKLIGRPDSLIEQREYGSYVELIV